MQKKSLAWVLALCATSSSAQDDLLACVDPDVRRGLLSAMPGIVAAVTRTVPDEFAGLAQSANLEFIGSSESDLQSFAAYKSDLAANNAMDTASEMLREAGWSEFAVGGPPSGGFVTGVQRQFDLFCRDDAMLNVMGNAIDDTTYVRLSVMPVFGASPCDELTGAGGRTIARAAGGAGLFEHMPTLALSDEITRLNQGMPMVASDGSISGTGRSASSEIEVGTALSIQNLIEHFGEQLEDQGWVRDAGWIGEHSSGSSWTRAATAELELAGLLDVVALGDAGYRASFRVSSLESE